MPKVTVLIIDDEPNIRVETIKKYLTGEFGVIRNAEKVEFIHSFTVPDAIDFDVVSFDGDGGVYGDYVKQLKNCTSVKIKELAVIHSMNPIKAKEFMFVLRNDLVIEGQVLVRDYRTMNKLVNGHQK